jgi:hypothetical protein
MQNAEFQHFFSISCNQDLIIYMLVKKEYIDRKFIMLMKLIDKQNFLYMVSKQGDY